MLPIVVYQESVGIGKCLRIVLQCRIKKIVRQGVLENIGLHNFSDSLNESIRRSTRSIECPKDNFGYYYL